MLLLLLLGFFSLLLLLYVVVVLLLRRQAAASSLVLFAHTPQESHACRIKYDEHGIASSALLTSLRWSM